jgi:hypothetical protein
MRSKRNKPKKFVGGGMIALQAGLAGVQYLHGMSQRNKAQTEYEKIKSVAPSLDTPSQYYENYKNAYDTALAQMETDAINRAYTTSLSALQSSGGRAVVGGLGAINQQRTNAQNQMMQQERQMRLMAGRDLAGAEENELSRKTEQSRLDMAQADASFQAGTQNMGRAVSGAAENIAYTMLAQDMYGTGGGKDRKDNNTGTEAPYDERDFEPGGSQYGSGLKINLPNWAKKAYSKYFETGGMVTPGEFSHKSNPIDIVKDGEKIGEATGNEVILNPEQQRQIANQSDYARKLFKQFAKNAKKK